MSSIKPATREVTLKVSASDARATILEQISLLNGRIVPTSESTIEVDFGSLLKSRLLGEFWVSKSTLPKRAAIEIEGTRDRGSRVKVVVRDTHQWGVKWGYRDKYEQSLQELADLILVRCTAS